MSREIQKISKQETTFNRIMQFCTDGDIVLSSEEEAIYARWNTAYKIFLQKKFTTEQIAQKVRELHGVSISTARNDVYQAQALFGGSNKTNKKFLLHHHAESIMLFIEKCKLDKSLVYLVPKLMAEYTRAIAAIPDELNKEKSPPPLLLFNVVEGQSVHTNTTYEKALENIRKRQTEDIEHEDIR